MQIVGLAIGFVLILLPFFAAFGIWLIWIMHNVQVTIFDIRAGKIFRVKHTRARKVKSTDGLTYYKLFFSKERIPPPKNYNTVFMSGSKDCIFLRKISAGDYRFINMDEVKGFYTMDEDMKHWMIQEEKRIINKHKNTNFWKEYGAHMINLGGLAILMIMLIFVLHYSQQLVPATDNIKETLKLSKEIEQIRAAYQNCAAGGGIPPG